jgi:predicted transcriptional regulator
MTPEQCLAARNLLGWTPADLACAAGVSAITVRHFEDGKIDGERGALTMMRRALEGAGIRFPAGQRDHGTVRLRSS